MSSGFSINGIINRTGSIPGAIRGDIADRPAAGNAPGDWYLAEDEQILYGWIGGAWVVLLDGSGSGATQDLQSVTGTAPGLGVTTNAIEVRNAANQVRTRTTAGASNTITRWSEDTGTTLIDIISDRGTGTSSLRFGKGAFTITTNLQDNALAASLGITWPNIGGGILQVSGNGLRLRTRAISANDTLLLTDFTLLVDTSAGNVTLTLPNTTTTGANFTGLVYNAKVAVTGNNIILSPSGGALIDGAATYTITGGAARLSAQFQFDGTNWWIL